jgi:hypothetical protein
MGSHRALFHTGSTVGFKCCLLTRGPLYRKMLPHTKPIFFQCVFGWSWAGEERGAGCQENCPRSQRNQPVCEPALMFQAGMTIVQGRLSTSVAGEIFGIRETPCRPVESSSRHHGLLCLTAGISAAGPHLAWFDWGRQPGWLQGTIESGVKLKAENESPPGAPR